MQAQYLYIVSGRRTVWTSDQNVTCVMYFLIDSSSAHATWGNCILAALIGSDPAHVSS